MSISDLSVGESARGPTPGLGFCCRFRAATSSSPHHQRAISKHRSRAISAFSANEVLGFHIPLTPRGCKEICPSAITSTCDNATDNSVTAQAEDNIFAVQCSMALDAAQLQGADVEPAVKNSSFAAYNSRCPSQHEVIPHSSNLAAERLSTIPLESIVKVTGSVKSYLAPGSVVWAKIGYHDWWPAEVMDKRAALERSNDEWDERLVLIQLYGVCEYAWVDPVRNLSQFDYCYEERSKDTSKAFQDALNQALRRKETTSSSELSDENYAGRSTMLNSHRASDDPINEGNGKRRWKPKVRFDDLTFPDNSARKMRRMKIMRNLGLTAPVGSPFSRPHARRRPLY